MIHGRLGSPSGATALTNTMVKGMFGLYSTITASATGLTVITMMELESEALAFRVMIPNLAVGAVAGVKASIAVGTGFDKPSHWITPTVPPGGSGWLPLKFGGQDTATLAARYDTNIPSLTESDLAALRTLPEANGGLPIVAVKVEYPPGSVVTCPANGIYGWRVDDGKHRILRASRQDVLGITNSAAYTTTASVDDQVPVPVVKYITVKQGKMNFLCGDSTIEGIGSSVRCWGALERACDEVSTKQRPVEYFNCGMYAQGPLVYSKALAYFVPRIQPSSVFYSPYSINNTPDGGMPPYAVDEDYFGLATVLDALRGLPKTPRLLLLEGYPTNAAYRNTGAGDQARRDLNAFLTTIGGALVLPGYAEASTGPRLPNGQDTIRTGYTDDDVHLNDTGAEALKAVVRAFV